MPKRKLVLEVEDDGTTVQLSIDLWETIGSSQVGPTRLFEGGVLSFPSPDVGEWARDMAVLFVERL
jgi:hypothetical protein